MVNNKLAIIGGSGLYDVEEFKVRELIKLNTPWGKTSDDILKTTYNKYGLLVCLLDTCRGIDQTFLQMLYYFANKCDDF